jgi:hypothetical protein
LESAPYAAGQIKIALRQERPGGDEDITAFLEAALELDSLGAWITERPFRTDGQHIE